MSDLEEKTPSADFRFIGKPVVRKEDERLTTGRGRFSDDFSVDGQAFAVMVRSPYPHARILGVDAASAQAMPGVLGVLSGADCLADGLTAIPHDPLPKTRYDMKLTAAGGRDVFIGPHMLLPADKARHVGEAVAMVVAETLAQALDRLHPWALSGATRTSLKGRRGLLDELRNELAMRIAVDAEMATKA